MGLVKITLRLKIGDGFLPCPPAQLKGEIFLDDILHHAFQGIDVRGGKPQPFHFNVYSLTNGMFKVQHIIGEQPLGRD